MPGTVRASGPTAEPAQPAPQRAAPAMRLAVISEGITSWPLYVAQANKMFEREGIDVEVTLTASSALQLEQLIKGGYDIGFQQSDHVVRAVERGSDLFAFMGHAHAPQLSLVVAPGINSFADLKDRDIAVDGARTGYALLLRKLLADQGLQDGDYMLHEYGGSQERFDALKSGTACASFLNSPFDRNLLAAGFKSLGTIKDFFPAYPGSVGAARRAWARQNEQRLIAFIRAFDASYAWLRDAQNKPEAIRILLARLNMDATTAASAYDEMVKRPLPEIAPAGLRQVINVVWEAEGFKGAQGAPDKYMDLSCLEKARQAR
jgi:ABC-type nitrate/sulfonate/bicarbonate transport system substrate-binding protein